MRRVRNMVLLAAFMVLSLAAMTFAQTSAATEKPPMMTKMSPDSAKAMMQKMSNNYQAMEKTLTELEHQLQSMMEMNDMDKLDAAMQKHMEAMRSMNRMLGEQHRMARMMMGPNWMGGMGRMQPSTGKTMEMKKAEPPPSEKKN